MLKSLKPEREKVEKLLKQNRSHRLEKKERWKDFFSVVSENENFLVINKNSGVSTQKNEHYVDSIEGLLPEKDILFSKLPRSGIVHRLDKETSGLLLIAKNDKYLKLLSNLFKEREIRKEYLSLHEGIFHSQHGEVSFYTSKDFSRTRKVKTKISSWNEGKFAKIEFEVFEKKNNFTLMKVFPLTGRTHQIRLAFQRIEFPIFNDQVYNKGTLAGDCDGQYLHASSLSFLIEDKVFKFSAPLPSFFLSKLKELQFSVSL